MWNLKSTKALKRSVQDPTFYPTKQGGDLEGAGVETVHYIQIVFR
jgi:hypothetical protein